ncbi:MAG: hypothetical protein K1X83_11855 [Oligoflexia bacterium]|nr:hypothetical protein [Oligoflexia bacterium]
MNVPIEVTCFYKFCDLSPARVAGLKSEILECGTRSGMRGLVLLAEEGINGTVSGSAAAIGAFKAFLRGLPEFSDLSFKDSRCQKPPFRLFKVDLRKEIVALGDREVQPWRAARRALSPAEWQAALAAGDATVLDTRNIYETALGKFRNAVDPGIKVFSDFRNFLKHWPENREKKILIYCTGGIRCEKAAIEMENQGFKNVYQLDGGILNYLAQFPDQGFEGECFVFDHRVAVDQALQPSQRYGLCPHCGDPAAQRCSCLNCSKTAFICERCAQERALQSCSKNCAYHLRRNDAAV